jgi:acyl-CoA thioester hydrolase
MTDEPPAPPPFTSPSGRGRREAPGEGGCLHTVRVYYEDTDAAGIVYHANYLRFAERARTEALRDLGIPHSEMLRDCNLMFVVRRVKVDYLRPARLDDSLEIATQLGTMRAGSVVLHQTVHGPNGPCAKIEVELACVPPNGTWPARIPQRWRDALHKLGVGSSGPGS